MPSLYSITGVAADIAYMYSGLCYMENRRRDRLGEEGREDRAFQDLTDKVSEVRSRLRLGYNGSNCFILS